MNNRLMMLIAATGLLALSGCDTTDNSNNPDVITMPTEMTQMQTQFGNFDPQTVMETLESAPIWNEEVLVDCVQQNGQLIRANCAFDKDHGYMPGCLQHFYVFTDNNICTFADTRESGHGGFVSWDDPMQYDPETRIITITRTLSDGSVRQLEARVLAMSNDAIMLEGSLGDTFTTTINVGTPDEKEVSYPDTFERMILRAGTQADLDRWQDAVPAN